MFINDYVAGFCDGEAYFGIIKKTSKVCTNGYFYKPVVKIAQTETCSYILDKFKEQFGGYISKTREYKEKNQRASKMWELSGRKSISKFIEFLDNKCILKANQIEVLNKLFSLPDITNSISGEERDKLFLLKEKYYQEIRLLNKRGVAETE